MMADRVINGYLFTTIEQSEPWVRTGIIASSDKCAISLEGSNFFERKDRGESRLKTGVGGERVFLWVGILTPRKDPITVLRGFEKYLLAGRSARLYMIYQQDDLLADVQMVISESDVLGKAVHLVGRKDQGDLPYWYSASDYFILGSHSEGSGFALIEAMACGCIPVVADIAPFRKITGPHGFLFEPGNPGSVCDMLVRASAVKAEEAQNAIVNYFNSELSFKKIAEDIYRAATSCFLASR